MNTNNTTHNSNSDWQILGELELPVDVSVEDTLYAWLIDILHPLYLQTELLNKIIVSAQDAIARAVHAEIVLKLHHMHVTVFVPSKRTVKEQAWSFFRLEKMEDAKDGQVGSDHAVAFYLYGEGD